MNPAASYAIVLDDHPLVGRGMAQFLQSIAPDLSAAVVTDWVALMHLHHEKGEPALLVADVWLASGHCLVQLAQWSEEHPHSPWIAVSGDDDPAVTQRVRAAGARAYVHKQAPPERFAEAVKAVLAGGEHFESPHSLSGVSSSRGWPVTARELGLTPRQGAILQRVLRGQPNKRIGADLGIAESTVKEHVTSILVKLGVRSRVEAIAAMRGRQLDLS